MSSPTTQINITLGTAGHVDHGKTSLVKFLTGCDTDRLKEEKERGMSIELGFAPCTIRDLEVGIVDVPGHENFIKTMVAGASGMDGVILVVAADDGVMPQTREHLDILTLLGVRNGLVALTKIDRVDAARREEVQAQIRSCLRGTFLESSPILPMSNVTGEGYDGFREALEDLVSGIRPRRTDGIFRLPVERAFAVKGYGTVVAGIPLAGQARVGDELILLPQNVRGRLRAAQVYQRPSETVQAGQCAALNVPQWDHAGIKRGQTVTIPEYFTPSEWFLCKLRVLPQEGFCLKNAARVRFHTGTSDVAATVYLLQGAVMQGGEDLPVQFRLEQPLVAGPGDHFIVRSPAPVRTVGGGVIIETLSRRLKRNQPAILQDALDHADALKDDKTLAGYCLRNASAAASIPHLSQQVKLPLDRVKGILDELVRNGQAVDLGDMHFLDSKRHEETVRTILDAVAEFHRQAPSSPGISLDDLSSRCPIDRPTLERMAARLHKEGSLALDGVRLALPGHRASVPESDRRQFETVELLFRARPYNPPDPAELSASARLKPDDVARILKLLTEQGRLVVVANGLWFHREAVDGARQALEKHIRKEGRLESVQFKYLLNTTRKYALPLLDYFDRIGVTTRSHNTRFLGQEPNSSAPTTPSSRRRSRGSGR